MSIPDNPYEPPLVDVVSPYATFSREEWRTMGKVFGWWVVGGAVVLTSVVAFQMNMALSQFGGQEYLARVMTMGITNQYASTLVIASMCNTLVITTDRRAKRDVLVPVRRLPLLVIIWAALATPIAMALMLALTTVITYRLDIPVNASLKGFAQGFHGTDVVLSILTVLLLSAAFVGSISQLMAILLRFRGRLILKCIILTQASGLLLYVIQRVIGFIRN